MLHRSRVSLALVAGALVVGAVPSSAVAAQEIEGQYIVVLKEQAGGDSAKRKARARGGKVQREFSRALNGFSATLDAKALAEVKRDPAVDYVEPDRVITLDATQSNPPSWGLDRIDQRDRPLSAHATPTTQTGAGVDAYIVDTGIRATHNDFGGRADRGLQRHQRRHGRLQRPRHARRGHGRRHHLRRGQGRRADPGAGAQLQRLGLDVGRDRGRRLGDREPSARRPAVANMSLGGGASTALDAAVQRAITDGVTFAVAAGNESQNACNVSPARARERDHGRRDDVDATRAPRSRTSARAWTSSPRARRSVAWYTAAPHEHDQRDLDGVAARRGRGRAACCRPHRRPPATVHGERSSRGDDRRRQQPRLGLAEPAAVHRPGRRRPRPGSGP